APRSGPPARPHLSLLQTFCLPRGSTITLGMDLEALVRMAAANGASDLHLEAGLAPALRVRGTLRASGDPFPAPLLLEMARATIGETQWPRFLERRSFDLSKTIRGIRCRINIFQTSRGVGFAVRLLAS